MTKQEAKRYINSSSTIAKESFSWVFTQETYHKTSADKFREAVQVLDGWIDTDTAYEFNPNPKYWPNNWRTVHKIVASIPDAVI